MVTLSKREARFLRFQRVGFLALNGEDGFPRTMPLCHVLHDDAVYVGTSGTSWKVGRVRDDDRATFLVHEYMEPWDRLRWLRLAGRVSVLGAGPEYEAARDRLLAKYPQYGAVIPWEDEEDVLLKLAPTAKASRGLD